MFLVLSENMFVSDYIFPYKDDDVIVLDKICNLKDIKKNIDILVIDKCSINNEGILNINNNIVFLDEIFISKKVKLLILNNKRINIFDKGFKKIKDMCRYYKIDLMVNS